MGGKYKFSEVEQEEIRAARRGNTTKRAEARLKALELRAIGKNSKEIGAVTDFHPAYITTLTAKYRAGGTEAVSGNHRNMSREKESELLCQKLNPLPGREKAAAVVRREVDDKLVSVKISKFFTDSFNALHRRFIAFSFCNCASAD